MNDAEALERSARSADKSFRTDAPGEPIAPCRTKDWIDFRLVDAAGNPMPGVRYRLQAAGGATVEGVTDADGCAGTEGLDPGTCRITWLPPGT